MPVLPVDVWTRIAGKLDLEDLVSVRLVCTAAARGARSPLVCRALDKYGRLKDQNIVFLLLTPSPPFSRCRAAAALTIEPLALLCSKLDLARRRGAPTVAATDVLVRVLQHAVQGPAPPASPMCTVSGEDGLAKKLCPNGIFSAPPLWRERNGDRFMCIAALATIPGNSVGPSVFSVDWMFIGSAVFDHLFPCVSIDAFPPAKGAEWIAAMAIDAAHRGLLDAMLSLFQLDDWVLSALLYRAQQRFPSDTPHSELKSPRDALLALSFSTTFQIA